ncbi:similar to Saccharomyces cerevisiae CAY80342 NIT1 Nitrilase, member of the nitrilase branch of the nitrilase superfamily [Saccharomyces cerevisiae EC1118] [Maudiozyma barnettii]|mgnify:CR=1 FL=1|uniref:Similar to Saccharomyces cerevisiae CAY80342 NIT1 Nitrilase, member of the nitrilase branch of the nitrilase superfamily [Saccharomyces cerevisiae EC1118] n=1 Tax=Maudiozyma barnettii TaxID=61262 RepID=A0A8H2VFQ3_9SACH|nr:similar to Saccharomyces cerevisiae CAY80342 NIT1 Nitrilase, member of the nitrilase branch of the nitrilase superfamily [Saccharomyces cerevisiae EC1118] [Kazachstania barnettii]CAB4254756.1 similar to Saccharomyces cerevisiae CAY80342 NIT1 Nitrilase, member of the nitrilase branch of the nitrilase superfamily [Saccharomyces cerevisiae EC1118] [Kazachstania barnettii]CAD1782875.1 similar to Saccharomyces cerevisiae CAY80342 NIT1 Nitrilase, member of the nitrilase branch of the nitrilase super
MSKRIVSALQIGSSPEGTTATIEKILSYESQIKESGTSLVVIPEATVGGYPIGSNFGAYVGYRTPRGRGDFKRYFKQSIKIGNDPECKEIKTLEGLSKRTGASLVVGCIERDSYTLYCTMVFIDPQLGYIGKHRKLQPTASERLIWGQGDGSTLTVVDSKVGKLGGAICWENTLPLLRHSMYAKGVQVWCAPTVEDMPMWETIMKNIAFEGRLFVVSAVQYVPSATEMGYGVPIEGSDNERILPGLESSDEPCLKGGSIIVDPFGKVLAGPLRGQEGLLVANIDLDLIIEGKYDLDVVGHYSRGDVFQLTVNEKSTDIHFV